MKDPFPRFRRPPLANSYSIDSAFTLVELLVFSSIILSLSAIGYSTMMSFSEERKLRAAGIELAGYLENARTMAQASNTPCTITITNEDGGVFNPDPSANPNSCRERDSIISSLNLSQASGSDHLIVEVDSGTGRVPYTFTPEGTTPTGITFLIRSSTMTVGNWCVDIQPPLATVRRGWRQQGSRTCNYAIEQ